jgi:hypothetical protein
LGEARHTIYIELIPGSALYGNARSAGCRAACLAFFASMSASAQSSPAPRRKLALHPKEAPMLNYSIMKPEGILVLKPGAPLTKEDFGGLGAAVDAYLADHDRLHGVLIRTEAFPGWENFGGFSAHMHFVRDHHKKVERVAVVTDSKVASVAESLGKHFTKAEIRHFPFNAEAEALAWLEVPVVVTPQ